MVLRLISRKCAICDERWQFITFQCGRHLPPRWSRIFNLCSRIISFNCNWHRNGNETSRPLTAPIWSQKEFIAGTKGKLLTQKASFLSIECVLWGVNSSLSRQREWKKPIKELTDREWFWHVVKPVLEEELAQKSICWRCSMTYVSKLRRTVEEITLSGLISTHFRWPLW